METVLFVPQDAVGSSLSKEKPHPKGKRFIAWILVSLFGLTAVCLTSIFIWRHHPQEKHPAKNYTPEQARPTIEELKSQAAKSDPKAELALGMRYYKGDGAEWNAIEAAQWFSKAAEHGESDAQYFLGLLYSRGHGVVRDSSLAVKWWQRAAANDHTKAQLELARDSTLLKAGIFGELSDGQKQTILTDLRKLVEKDNSEALLELASLYEEGRIVTQNHSEAIRLYQKAAQALNNAAAAGETEAMVQLGSLYVTGNGVPTNRAEGIQWYQKAVSLGSTRAMIALGNATGNATFLIDPDTGLPAWINKDSLQWYQKAAESGDTEAMSELVWCSDKNPTTGQPVSLHWARKLAEFGCPEEMLSLGGTYLLHGERVPQDYAEAMKWYRRAAEIGYKDAQYELARLYDQGVGVTADKTEAAKWYTKAAEQGVRRAQFYLGVQYNTGEGVTKDQQKAFQWFLKAADVPDGSILVGNHGIEASQFNVGMMYKYGEGVAKDLQAAFKWFFKAAQNGSASAQFELGRVYETGVGVLQDKQEAFKWYQKAAYQGHQLGQRKVGRFYGDAGNSPQNRIAAHKWLSLAAAQSDEIAAKERDSVAARMNTQELAEASRQAKAFSVGEPPSTNNLPVTPIARAVPQAMRDGVPVAVYNQIATDATKEWPGNYNMQAYEIKNQIEAYRKLHP